MAFRSRGSLDSRRLSLADFPLNGSSESLGCVATGDTRSLITVQTRSWRISPPELHLEFRAYLSRLGHCLVTNYAANAEMVV